ASNNIVAEGAWDGSSFSTGDLATTFRVPDARGEFFRAYDDGRGVDSGRSNNLRQADSLKDHTHAYIAPASGAGTGTTPNYFFSSNTGATTGSPSTGAATETRPRNIVKLACIKY
ncbi:MAG: phage tail protein, partial [Rhizomicrobium sp.]